MSRRELENEDPDRLYIVTGGRSDSGESSLDLVTLIVSECDPAPGMQSEHARILRLCRRPTAVVEVSSELGLPVSVVKILLCDLLDTGRVTARHPSSATAKADLPDPETLKQVLVGLERL
ncbi:uncharacterized protein DUF742 [Saccharopolyspora erythraea NRRL 2338]|uniref:Uncharacterized protein n=2 Tax=Saccharopolyspora erythraea TaxID=1836 RepID=A4F8V4_SACEN|nr:DUF742 domain-containing protein [Saccharopolyspora erythraea]EQD86738.1 hypothetical protein N599_07885 [Saccharopolyspora erythraea D]PFG94276.1 uncharacterized protein DUF742 [Saccharopolyspora erythraea NRRL 2338]QRK91047.1 DUF742 domain-containing protein [Saccharopolyspora erythraea]CAM00479.1 hypothetical protein SACE_1151 [Saccharopolyspora erythraea NRRL 2338]